MTLKRFYILLGFLLLSMGCVNYASAVTVNCLPGKYMGPGNSCVWCPSGKTTPGGNVQGSASCLTCPAGQYCTTGFAAASCPSGTYSNATGATSASVCTGICPAGTSSLAGSTVSTACQGCTSGYYCSGGAAPTACPAGTYSSATSATSASSCTACPAGASSLAGSTASTSCQACSAGYSCAGGVAPTACPAGTFASSAGSGTCTACPVGSYCPAAAATSATACPLGTTTTTTGNTTCQKDLNVTLPTCTNPGSGTGMYRPSVITASTLGGNRVTYCFRLKTGPLDPYCSNEPTPISATDTIRGSVGAANGCIKVNTQCTQDMAYKLQQYRYEVTLYAQKTCYTGQWVMQMGHAGSGNTVVCPSGTTLDDNHPTATGWCVKCPTGKTLQTGVCK